MFIDIQKATVMDRVGWEKLYEYGICRILANESRSRFLKSTQV